MIAWNDCISHFTLQRLRLRPMGHRRRLPRCHSRRNDYPDATAFAAD